MKIVTRNSPLLQAGNGIDWKGIYALAQVIPQKPLGGIPSPISKKEMEKLRDWVLSTNHLLGYLDKAMKEGAKIQYPRGTPVVRPEAIAAVGQMVQGLKAWENWAVAAATNYGIGFQWTDEKVDELVKYIRGGGKSIAGAAKRLGCSTTDARLAIEQLKVSSPGIFPPAAKKTPAGGAAPGAKPAGGKKSPASTGYSGTAVPPAA